MEQGPPRSLGAAPRALRWGEPMNPWAFFFLLQTSIPAECVPYWSLYLHTAAEQCKGGGRGVRDCECGVLDLVKFL